MTVPVHLGPPSVSSDIVFLAFLSYVNTQAPGHLTDEDCITLYCFIKLGSHVCMWTL